MPDTFSVQAMIKSVGLLCALRLLPLAAAGWGDATMDLSVGPVKGNVWGDAEEFLAIPYASIPKRFDPSVPLDRLPGKQPFDATNILGHGECACALRGATQLTRSTQTACASGRAGTVSGEAISARAVASPIRSRAAVTGFVRILHMCSLQNLCMSHYYQQRTERPRHLSEGATRPHNAQHANRSNRPSRPVRRNRNHPHSTCASSGSHISTRTPALSARRRRAPSSPRVRCILARIPLATSGPPQEAAPARQMTTGIHASQSSA